ncbi:Holliday junction resolvase RecU [Paenibacillus oleatilyticus]|uniref:Holliday junction resolvase RecU n=1 Tax=Paenibacillus oleatilyticus TaxID=2594886 RepID=A0ABV4UZK8_9BACL
MSYANRGMSFENLIEHTNMQYETMGLAVVNKRPTPIRVTSNKHGRVTGFFEKPSTVDFDGTLAGGRSIVFEAKQVKLETRFELKNIEEHQVEYLEKCHRLGAVSFILVEFESLRTIYLLPYESLKYYWDRRQSGGRGTQSIPLGDFEVNAWEVKPGRVPVDYLPIVYKIWNLGAA